MGSLIIYCVAMSLLGGGPYGRDLHRVHDASMAMMSSHVRIVACGRSPRHRYAYPT
jgi:hypothetical protein